jgi:cytochrome c peroxidase
MTFRLRSRPLRRAVVALLVFLARGEAGFTQTVGPTADVPDDAGAFFDTGVSNEGRRTPDPGRALVTGKCGDIGAFKVPTLRGVAARPPFFHDGSAATFLRAL